MQPRVNSVNQGLTEDEVVALITNPAIEVSAGSELLRPDLSLIADISDFLVSGTIKRNNYNTIHGTCDLVLENELDWGTAIVRPYLKMSGHQSEHITGQDVLLSGRWNLGAYYLTTPDYSAGIYPRTFSVQGYDLLQGLISPVGDSVQYDAATSYVGAVEFILEEQGYYNHKIDHEQYDIGMTTARVWPIDENTSWLSIINDLLAAVGYRGLWVDWDGYFRSEPYTTPSLRPTEWVYDTGSNTTILGDRSRKVDFFNAPNRWIATRANLEDGVAPVEGAGVYTYINQNDGPTSVNARGRTITKMWSIESANQEALETSARITIDADMRIDTEFNVQTGTNPLHWHFDRLTLIDDEYGAPAEVQVKEWTLPLDGSMMTQSWTVV